MDAINQERATYADTSRRMTVDFQQSREALLRAGGAKLDHQPGYEDRWETAIRRLVQLGELRETIDYATFPTPPTYHYSLTPRGELATAELECKFRS